MFQFPAFASYPYVFESKIPFIDTWKPFLFCPHARACGAAHRILSRDNLSWESNSKLGELRKADRPSPQVRRARAGQPRKRRYGRERTKMIFQASKVGCPIRKFADQIVCADPRDLSQLITSFFASESLGIPHAPLICLLYFLLF